MALRCHRLFLLAGHRNMQNDTSTIQWKFAQQVERRNRHDRRGVLPAVGFCMSLLTIGILRPSPSGIKALAITAVTFWLWGMLSSFRAPALECPHCERRVDGEIVLFCPECGSVAIDEGNWRRGRHCGACGATLTHGKGGPRWRINSCTHCGTLLADKPV